MKAHERRAIHAAMVRFADGERDAFREVFDMLWPFLLALTQRSLPSRADAEDAAQRAILKVFDRIVDLDRTRDGVVWAMTIAGYEVLTIRRQHERRREDAYEVALGIADARPLPIAMLLDEELDDTLRAMIDELSVRDREAIGALTQGIVPIGEAARKRRTRAVDRLRALWRKAHG